MYMRLELQQPTAKNYVTLGITKNLHIIYKCVVLNKIFKNHMILNIFLKPKNIDNNI